MREGPTANSIDLFQQLFGAHPAHTALLDLKAKIQAVNQSWLRFGQENEIASDYEFIHADYLAVCEHAVIEQSPYAADVVAGLLGVLAAGRTSFAMVYPCHSPTEHRWFKMWVQAQMPAVPAIVVAHTYLGPKLKRTESDSADETEEPTDRSLLAIADRLTGAMLLERLHQFQAAHCRGH